MSRKIILEFEEASYGGWVARNFESWRYGHEPLAVIPASTDMGQFLCKTVDDRAKTEAAEKATSTAGNEPPVEVPSIEDAEPCSFEAPTPDSVPDDMAADIAAEEARRLDKEKAWKEL